MRIVSASILAALITACPAVASESNPLLGTWRSGSPQAAPDLRPATLIITRDYFTLGGSAAAIRKVVRKGAYVQIQTAPGPFYVFELEKGGRICMVTTPGLNPFASGLAERRKVKSGCYVRAGARGLRI